MSTKPVTCAHCGTDLSKTNADDTRLHLIEEPIPGNVVSAGMLWDLKLTEPTYFCGIGCLKQWLNRSGAK